MFPSVEHLLPHKPPMRLVDTLLEAGDSVILASATLRPDCLFVDAGGGIAVEIYPELVAQTFAAGAALRAGSRGQGYLAAVKDAAFLEQASIGETLHIRALLAARIGDIALVTGEVRRSTSLLAHLELKIFLFS